MDLHVTIVRPAPGVFYTEFFGYVLADIASALDDLLLPYTIDPVGFR